LFFAGLLVAVLFLFVFALPLKGYAVHKGAGGLTCGQCHTMHNSQGDTSLGGLPGGSMILLRGKVSSRAEIHKLCLQCHASNGAQADDPQQPHGKVAPKVYSEASIWDSEQDGFDKIGAGGNFSSELDSDWNPTTSNYQGYGHSIGSTDVMPPGGDVSIAEFSCTNCHDPHGADVRTDTKVNLFRNLKVNAFGAGANSGAKFRDEPSKPWYEFNSYVGGVNGSYSGGGYFGGDETDNGSQVIWPVYKGTLTGNPETDSTSSNSYATGWDGDGAVTMSKWCAQCHDNWHEEINTSNQAHVDTLGGTYDLALDTRRHAVNSMMPRAADAGCAGGCHVSLLDRTNYSNNLIIAGKGLPVTASQYYTANAYYLPECGSAGNPFCSGMDKDHGGTSGNNHKVFCLTCHFAHGGPYYDNLRWDYLKSVSSGEQAANSIASTKGCQLCHNR
jgi:hypothetical protein